MRKIGFSINIKSILFILAGIIINYAGRNLAAYFELPFWLDTPGTMLCAVMYGPLAGGITGLISNVIFSVNDTVSLYYTLTNVAVGIIVGFLYPENRKENFGIMVTAVVSSLATVAISTPLNLKFYEGYTGNIWGDAFFDMLVKSGNSTAVTAVLSEGFIDFPDKMISLYFVSFIILIISRFYKDKKSGSASAVLGLVAALFAFNTVFCPVSHARGRRLESEYMPVVLGVEKGVKSVESNAVAQSGDDYIWVGSYSGLYVYDGIKFNSMLTENGVNNVMVLFSGDDDNLWIGTNDSGAVKYNTKTRNVTIFDTHEQTGSNSIRSFCKDRSGDIYAGTTGTMVKIDKQGNITHLDEYSELNYVWSLECTEDNIITGVTNSGILFFMKDDILRKKVVCPEQGAYFTALCKLPDGKLAVGSSGNNIYVCDPQNPASLEIKGTMEGVYGCSDIMYDDELEGLLIGGDNGLYFLGNDGGYIVDDKDGFNTGISCIIRDRQENLWFASNKNGVCKYSKNPFVDVLKSVGVDSAVANAVIIKDNILYAGTDTGLVLMDIKRQVLLENEITELFRDVRIRHILEDSKGNIWVSTYGADGLVCLNRDGSVDTYTENASGTVGGRFRLTLELSDGTILAGTNVGLSFIKNGRVISTLSEKDGLSTSQILDVRQKEDGTILAASDGDGIYIIKDRKITGHIGEPEGLYSPVILKIVPCDTGFIYVTSNALYYHEEGRSVRRLNNFPYTNNYDVYIDEALNNAWISSSAGLFKVDAKELIDDKSYDYSLYNQTRGLNSTLTANSWSYADGMGKIYLCSSTGIREFELNRDKERNNLYNMDVISVAADGGNIVKRDDVYHIPPKTSRLDVSVAVLNYTLSNPLLHVFLRGFDSKGVTCYQSELENISYTNIPAGNYGLCIQVLDDITHDVVQEKNIILKKEPQFYELTKFRVYLYSVIVLTIIFFTYMMANYRMFNIIKDDYNKMEEARIMAEEANHAKNSFLASIAHEIRERSYEIRGLGELIIKESGKNAATGYAGDIVHAVDSLVGSIEAVMDNADVKDSEARIVPIEHVSLLNNKKDNPEDIRILNNSLDDKEGEKENISFKAPGARLLLVDDRKITHKIVKEMLKDTDIKIDSAHTGSELLYYVKEKHYDIILLDYLMPRMNGVEAVERMRVMAENKNFKTPIIMFTANNAKGARERYKEAGFTDYLAKPVSERDLREIVKKYIPEPLFINERM